ncbi:MAG: hypothetical protein ACK46O_09580 [Flavobacteriia bacterium]|jgi:hypothetical protein
MKNPEKSYLSKIDIPKDQRKNPEVLRVILNENYTQIDFGYVAEWIYIRGGWIRIAPHTFIQVQGSENRYAMTEARNITIAPEQHHFESKQDWRVFTLFFEPIPIKDCVINIIEEENPNNKDFNFYGISLKDVRETEILSEN